MTTTERRPVSRRRLFQLLSYNPLTGVFRWKVSPNTSIRVGAEAGRVNDDGYVRIGIDGKQYAAHRLAWFFMKGRWPLHQIDHDNRDKRDNRFANLKPATNLENHHNKGPSRLCTSGTRGVTWNKKRQKWEAAITTAGSKTHLGYHVEKADAVSARQNAEQELWA